MAFDETLARRIREAFAGKSGITEKRMFGGLCFMLQGNMLCGVEKSGLMLRVGKEAYASALAEPHCRVMDLTGRPLAGYVIVDPPGLADSNALQGWLSLAERHVGSLAPKSPGDKRPAGTSRGRKKPER